MKKEQLRLPDYLNHITQAIERINVYIKDIGKEGWVASTLIQDAVIRNIEIIGEASHNVQTLHQEFAWENADFPWDDAYWMRPLEQNSMEMKNGSQPGTSRPLGGASADALFGKRVDRLSNQSVSDFVH